jgi:hypothetical protein
MRGTVPIRSLRLGGGKKAVMQGAECVSGFDWSFDSRIAIEAVQIPREIPRRLAAFVKSKALGRAGL